MFAICRIKKHKSYDLGNVDAHNQRTMEVPHRDPRKSIKRLYGDKNLTIAKLVENRIHKMNVLKPRKDAVVAVEIMLSVSPEYFRNKKENWGTYDNYKTLAWKTRTLNFVTQYFRRSRIAEISLHLDEATPHIHAIIVPIVKKKRNKRRTQAQIKAQEKPQNYETLSLCAKDLFNPQQLRQLQTTYAKYLEELGIQRGISKSKASHTTTKQYYNTVCKEIDEHNFNIKIPAKPIAKKPSKFSNLKKWTNNINIHIEKFVNEITYQLKGAQDEMAKLKLALDFSHQELKREKNRTRAYSKFGSPEMFEKEVTDFQKKLKERENNLEVKFEQLIKTNLNLKSKYEKVASELAIRDSQILSMKQKLKELEPKKNNDSNFYP